MKTTQIFIISLKNEALSFLLLIVLWGGASLFFPVYIIPSPAAVLLELGSYLTPDFLQQFGLTLYRVLIGFSISFILGTTLGVLAVVKKWENPLNAMMLALQVLPGTILGVIFVLMFGIGSTAPILLILFLVLPMMAVNTINGLAKRSPALEEVLVTLKSKPAFIIRYSFLPALVPVFQSNLSLGLSLAMKIVVLGEFIGSQDGLGYLLNHARILFDMKAVFFYLVVLLGITLIFQALQSLFFATTLKRYYLAE
jgi:ABC-type nitrate/sulfonate/bicarbonate transport system permease component